MEIKKINIKLSALREISNSLSKLLTQDLPVKQAYRFSKLAKNVQTEMNEMNEHINTLIRKYGEPDGDGNTSVKSRIEEYFTELNPMLNEEVELSFIPVDLNEVESLRLSPMDIINLESFIDEKSETLLEAGEPKVIES